MGKPCGRLPLDGLSAVLSDWEVEEAYRDWKRGIPKSALALRYSVCERTIQRAFDRLEVRDGITRKRHVYRPVTAEDMMKLAELWNSGKTAQECADALGLSEGVVNGRLMKLRRAGLLEKRKYGHPRSKHVQERAHKVRELVSQGMPVKEIAAMYGTCLETIYSDLRRKDI